MPTVTRAQTGRRGEDLACEILAKRGYEVVERNWRCARGEVDVVAREGDCWVFVEVKTRRGGRRELPEFAFTPRKAERLATLAQLYLDEHALQRVSWRIDLVAVELDSRGQVRHVELIPGVGVT